MLLTLEPRAGWDFYNISGSRTNKLVFLALSIRSVINGEAKNLYTDKLTISLILTF